MDAFLSDISVSLTQNTNVLKSDTVSSEATARSPPPSISALLDISLPAAPDSKSHTGSPE